MYGLQIMKEEDANEVPSLDNLKSNITDVINYACHSWPFHVQKHGEDNIDNHLATLLKLFLGSIDNSSLAYRNWHEVLK